MLGKLILAVLLGYLAFRLLKQVLPAKTRPSVSSSGKSRSQPDLNIREEDIQDAEYHDLTEGEQSPPPE